MATSSDKVPSFFVALEAKDSLEAWTILHAIEEYSNIMAERKKRGEPIDQDEYRAASKIFIRAHEALSGRPMIFTESPARLAALMAGEPDPGEPEKPEPS